MQFVLYFVFQVIEKSDDKDEIAEGTVTVADPPQNSKHKRGRKKR